MAYTKVKPLMVASFPSSRLTGAFGAISGANLTGLGDGIDTKSASSDPVINTNPAAVGHTWLNKTSGEMFICTDATSNENIWINIGSGVYSVYTYQGTQFGYHAGGQGGPFNPAGHVIERYPFASDGNSVDIGNLASGPTTNCWGGKSITHGYCQGQNTAVGAAGAKDVQKYSFASNANGVSVGTLNHGRYGGIEASSETHVYSAGGDGSTGDNKIEKIQSYSDSDGINVGDLLMNVWYAGGSSSATHGFTAGGYPTTNVIQKYSFSTDGNATDVGDTAVTTRDRCGGSSKTHGYVVGGYPNNNQMSKWAFASQGNSTDVGDLTTQGDMLTPSSSTTHGYCGGGRSYGGTPQGNQQIQKYSFASDGNATNCGSLTVIKQEQGAGSQV